MAVEPTVLDSITAFSSLFINVIGYSMGVISLRIWTKSKQQLVLLSSILFFTLPSPWLVDFLIYIVHIITGGTINYTFAIIIAAWSVPILSTSWAFITATFFRDRPYLKWVLLGVMSVLDLIFYILVWGFHKYNIEDVPGSVILNVNYGTFPNIIIVIYGLIGLVFVFPTFTYLALKSTDQLFKLRSYIIATGTLLFTIGAVADAILVFHDVVGIIFLRLMVLGALICLYLGFNTPKSIRNKYKAE